MDRIDPHNEVFECVEPELGHDLPLLDQSDIAPELQQRLRDHLSICDACRLEHEIKCRLESGLRDGTLNLKPTARGHRQLYRRALAWSGAGALAAALFLAMLLPPSPRGQQVLQRGNDQNPHFLRPLEGEVVTTGRPHLRWSAISGATGYEVEVDQIGGSYNWSGWTTEPDLRLPPEGTVPVGERFRVIVRPIPADLAGPVALSTSFVRAGRAEFLGYRLTVLPLPVIFVAGVGLILLLMGLSGLPYLRRSP